MLISTTVFAQNALKNIPGLGYLRLKITAMIRYISMNRILPDTTLPYHKSTIVAISNNVRAESALRLIFNIKITGSLSETKIGRVHRLKMSILPGPGRFWRAFF